jgi:hypothetical protein
MPRYTLRFGSKRVPVASTDTALSKAIGKRLAGSTPATNVDSSGGGHGYSFAGQELTYEDLRDIKDMRDSGGQVAQLMDYKALLNFGEGGEIHVEDDDETEQVIDGDPMTLSEWLTTEAFPKLDLLILDLGGDALWYPYAVGEIQETVTGDFKRALPAEPWTLIPQTNGQGEVVAWNQRTKNPSGGYTEQTLPADDLWHIVVNKASARDETGISEVLRNKDEIQAFKQNEQAINQAIELHGFPQRHIKVGKEDGAPVRDDDLRRVRTIFDPRTTDANTAYFTGQDVDVETLEAHQFDYEAIHEMDMRNLTTALGLPLEAGNVGSDGLGSGKPAELRFALLKLAIKANQRSFSVQFVERVMRPAIRDHSPFDHTAEITLSINDPLEDIGDMADVIQQVGGYMTNEQVADKLDIAAPEDDDVAESYRSPADIEKAEEEGSSDDPFGGMFNSDSDRHLQDIEDIDTGDYPDAAVENAQMALDAREDTGNPNDCGTQVGWERANQLVNGEDLSEDTIERMASFARHEDNKEQGEDGRADCGWLMWKAWGGDEGIAWAERKSEQIDQARENSALSGRDTGNSHRCLGGVTDSELQHAPEWDEPLLEMYQGVTDPDSATDRALVSFASSGTPEFVLDRIREAIMSGSIFSDIDGVSGDEIMDFRQEFADSLAQDNFTLDDVTETVMQFTGEDRDSAEVAARTELGNTLKAAREDGYQERDEAQDSTFYWTGANPGDDRQTDACGYLIAGSGGHLENSGAFSELDHPEGTNPFEGGTPIPMDELKELVAAAARADPEITTDPRTWTPHIQCRSTFSKAPPNWQQL